MTLIYAGIDEAGYGPRLGPLCTALSAFTIDNWEPDSPAPDLWRLLRAAVCTSIRDATAHGRIAIADSKLLKRPRTSRTIHPLMHLEIGVLAALACLPAAESFPTQDSNLLARLQGEQCRVPRWYASPPLGLPLSTDSQFIHLRHAQLAAACTRAGVRPILLRAVVTDETRLNEHIRSGATKADVALRAVGRLVRCIWESDHSRMPPHTAPRIIIDRQGGRTHYAESLQRMLPGAHVSSALESTAESRYDIAGEHDGHQRTLTIHFRVNAEQHHLPVALASMTAKYIRELFMERFNRYWSSRFAKLKPTAGYGTDARRWLRDAHGAMTPHEREAVVRRA